MSACRGVRTRDAAADPDVAVSPEESHTKSSYFYLCPLIFKHQHMCRMNRKRAGTKNTAHGLGP